MPSVSDSSGSFQRKKKNTRKQRKYQSHSYSSPLTNNLHRITLGEIAHTNNILLKMINKGATKRAYDSEDEEYSQSLVTRGKTLENTKQEVYAQPDYPEVKYWTKKQWKDAENNNKDASDLLENKDKRRGATRSAMGENVMMLYIEHANRRRSGGPNPRTCKNGLERP